MSSTPSEKKSGAIEPGDLLIVAEDCSLYPALGHEDDAYPSGFPKPVIGSVVVYLGHHYAPLKDKHTNRLDVLTARGRGWIWLHLLTKIDGSFIWHANAT